MRFKKSFTTNILVGLVSLFLFASPALAHVIVYPKQVGIAKTQIFDMSVPVEKDNPTVALKLLIPNGVEEVIPNAKEGWTVSTVKKDDKIVEIDWTNGSIPSGDRDDFYFQAQVAPTPTTLQWKAYQTYQDGSIIAWDHAPTSNPEDDSAPPPYSTTKVIDDLKPTPSTPDGSSKLPLTFSIVALALSAMAFGFGLRKK